MLRWCCDDIPSFTFVFSSLKCTLKPKCDGIAYFKSSNLVYSPFGACFPLPYNLHFALAMWKFNERNLHHAKRFQFFYSFLAGSCFLSKFLLDVLVYLFAEGARLEAPDSVSVEAMRQGNCKLKDHSFNAVYDSSYLSKGKVEAWRDGLFFFFSCARRENIEAFVCMI